MAKAPTITIQTRGPGAKDMRAKMEKAAIRELDRFGKPNSGDTTMKKASEAKADTKRQMNEGVSKDRHGLKNLEHMGKIDKGGMRSQGAGHASVERKMGKGKC